MSNNTGFFDCKRTCWIIGGLIGFALWLMISGIIGLIIGAVIGVALAIFLQKIFCAEAANGSEEVSPISDADAGTTMSAAVAETPSATEAPEPEAEPVEAPAEEPAPAEQPVEIASGAPKKPRTMKAPRKAGADDLKQLKGVGPKLEQTLNDLGFWHFDQIAKWGADEIAWVDDNLKFKGRIERDGWVEQAKTLAAGGETEFSSKVKKGKVY